ncbi:glycoside hydrolase family 27 protein [bacterium BMS3Abin03]|nr:glycoside hydrolase family 27 protein [bacterium BMS3Abin03]MCG6960176.1 glycoside hydrolase family 27 protein [bacterium BMS3Abin03]
MKKHYIITCLFSVSILLLSSINIYPQKFKNLALTPPMGWNSWNAFACDINEDLIKKTADEMVASGMKDAGYVYIVIDDCWQLDHRDSLGFIIPDLERFPSGIKSIADYIHSKGLKFGIHSCAGSRSCADYPGSRGHEYQDAITYASWGVDYLKYDWCNTEGLNAEGAYTTMRDALYSAGRPVVFSLCEWGNNKPWEWGAKVGHLWRTTGDIINCFDCVVDHGTWKSWGVLPIIDKQDELRKYAGPDHWNDPDMLEVGNGLTLGEDRAHFSMWCMLAAPLIAGNDIRNMSEEIESVLTNRDVIAVDQDSLGVQGFKFISNGEIEVWFKPLVNGDWAMCVLNRSSSTQKFSFDWSREYISDDLSKRKTDFNEITYNLKNLWTGKDAGTTQQLLNSEIPSHDVLMLRLSPVQTDEMK